MDKIKSVFNKGQTFLNKIKNMKNTFYIMLYIIIILLVLTITLLIVKDKKSKRILELNKEITIMKDNDLDRLKNSSEYEEFKEIIKAFGTEMYIQACESYSSEYFKVDETENINGKLYWKIYRIEEIENLYTEDRFNEYIKDEKIIKQDEEYYILAEEKEENEFYVLERSGILEINNITENKIEFTVEEMYYNYEYEVFDINDTTIKTNKFVLVKEGRIWKVDKFTYPNE